MDRYGVRVQLFNHHGPVGDRRSSRRASPALSLGVVATFVTLVAACQGGPETGAARQGLIGGTTTDLEGVAVTYNVTDGNQCAGAVVGPRHVIVPDFCVHQNGIHKVFVGASINLYTDTPLSTTDVRIGPLVVHNTDQDVHIAMLVTTEDLGVEPLTVSSATPLVGDDLRLLGYTSTNPVLSEGAVEVISVGDATFMAEGGTVLLENGWDGSAVNAQDELVGQAYAGVPNGNGADPVIYITVAGLSDWIHAQVGDQPQADAGVESDGGTGPSDNDDGCACHTGAGPDLPGALLLWLGVLLLVVRRRRLARRP